MNQIGFDTAMNVAYDYFGITLTKQWLDDHFAIISSYFPLADDPDFLKYYPDEECWWTFRAECESGGLTDTSARDRFGNALAMILTKREWPLNGEAEAVTASFYKALKRGCAKNGLMVD